MTVPREAGEGNAVVSLSYVAWTERSIAPAEFEVPVPSDPSDHSELSFVMFPDPEQVIRLNAVNDAFRQIGVSARMWGDGDTRSVLINANDGPTFSIVLKRGDDVQGTARLLGDATPFAAVLAQCDTRFEIGIVDLEEALDEEETLRLIQTSLQTVTGGIIYNTWDEELRGPE
jgi:hypothetical protein